VRVGRAVESLPLFNSQGSGGPANIPEFGTVTNAAGLANLYDMDTIQHVKIGTQYPAVLVTTGLNDSPPADRASTAPYLCKGGI
jgi:hypothetical protein